MKRWLVAAAALALGGGASAVLLVIADPARDSIQAYATTRDLPAGAVITADVVQLERVSVVDARSLLFAAGDEAQLTGRRASHALMTGQLIQRSDVLDPGSVTDRRLVFVPVKDAPAASPGARVDLLVLSGGDHPSVKPFAIGVEVRAQLANGLVLVVGSRQAAAFVYAATSMRLAAVIAEPGAEPGAESPIDSADQAMAEASRR